MDTTVLLDASARLEPEEPTILLSTLLTRPAGGFPVEEGDDDGAGLLAWYRREDDGAGLLAWYRREIHRRGRQGLFNDAIRRQISHVASRNCERRLWGKDIFH